MAASSPTALITDQGRNVLLRLEGRSYQLTQESLREVLGLPDGPPGLGISIDGDQLQFEFAGDNRSVTFTAAQLQRRLATQTPARV
jgi:hypothetical protein